MNKMARRSMVFAALVAPTALLAQELQSASEEVSASTPIPAAAVSEVNKAATTHVKTSAKSRVDNDIDAWCKEMNITLGFVKGKNSFYIKGVERVAANVNDPSFIKSRSLAYSKAYQNAVASYIFQKFGSTSSEQFNKVFNDFSSGGSPSADVKSSVERIADKAAKLTEAQLDEGLRKLGVSPEGDIDSKRTIAKNEIIKQTIKKASGDSAGLLPVQTFEGWDENGKYAVGVVIRGGMDTEIVAECLKNKVKPLLSRPESGMTVAQALPSDEEIVSQFGVRMFFDENGTPALLSIGQWGSSYTGDDEDMEDAALDHARDQATDEANDHLTMFINSTLSMSSESQRGEEKGREVASYADGSSVEKAVKSFVDRRFQESAMRGSDTARGRTIVGGYPKIITHPSSGQKIAVSAIVWSFEQYNAMSGITDRPKQRTKPQEPISTSPGNRRGRTYDF